MALHRRPVATVMAVAAVTVVIHTEEEEALVGTAAVQPLPEVAMAEEAAALRAEAMAEGMAQATEVVAVTEVVVATQVTAAAAVPAIMVTIVRVVTDEAVEEIMGKCQLTTVLCTHTPMKAGECPTLLDFVVNW